VGGSWLEAAKYKFMELARHRDLVALVQGTGFAQAGASREPHANLRLVDTSGESFDIWIDEVLVKMKYAALL